MNNVNKFNFEKVEFEDVNCLFCKAMEKKELLFRVPDRINNLPGIFSLVKCKNCGLVFQSPRPKEQFIKYYYPDWMGYFQPLERKQSGLSRWIKSKVLFAFYDYKNLGNKKFFIKFLFFPIYLYFFKHQLIPKYIKNGKLLEIGCSNGTRLEKLKRWGWKVTGVELNKKAAIFGIEKRGLDIRIGSIFDFEFPSDSFDVIVMDMVLEHLYHPDKVILKITKWLKPKGQLMFSIPYFEGLEFRLFKEYAYSIHLPCHTYFFNKNHIKKLLNGHYQNIKFVFHHFDRDVVASSYYKYQDRKKLQFRFIAHNKTFRFLVIKPLIFLLSLLNKTSRVTVFAQKIR